MVLLLPALMHLSGESGLYLAKGMLAGQVTSIFGAYTFSLTIPRALENLHLEMRGSLITEVISFQFILGILGFTIFLITQTEIKINEFYGYIIIYSGVIQWQWFHITNKKEFIQPVLIIITRMLLIIFEVLILLNIENLPYISLSFTPFATILICLPIAPTLLLIEKIKFNKKNGNLLISEIKKGKHLFFASLLSSIYSVGPSLIVANVNPQQLVLIQQFDRVRLAVSNLAGLFLNATYPFLIDIKLSKLISGFLNIQKFILIPAIFISFLILMAGLFLPNEALVILGKLQMNRQSFSLAMVAGIMASSSNTITLTFLHIINNDRLYFNVIFFGAIFFLLMSLFLYLFINYSFLTLGLMTSVVLVELFINSQLWVKSKRIIKNYKKEDALYDVQ